MSRTACPNGHMSADPEWCDTCGARLGAAPAPVPAASPPVAQSAQVGPSAQVGQSAQAGRSLPANAGVAGLGSVSCPHCGAANVNDALFCEECGYDFTTGQAPEPAPVTEPPMSAGVAQPAQPTPAAGPHGWIAIVEVDPAWFAMKGALADRACPSSSSSTVPLSHAVVHIGRSSQSRGIHPEIALDSDTAVSRHHAQLIAVSTTGGPEATPDAFGVTDLGSTNGTFVVPAGADLTESIEPIAPGPPTTLADGDRVYIGAWSRLTIRRTGA